MSQEKRDLSFAVARQHYYALTGTCTESDGNADQKFADCVSIVVIFGAVSYQEFLNPCSTCAVAARSGVSIRRALTVTVRRKYFPWPPQTVEHQTMYHRAKPPKKSETFELC